MRKWKNFLLGLSLLNDWQEELDRAFAVAEENEVRYSALLGALEPEVPEEKECLLFDLEAYRSMKASA